MTGYMGYDPERLRSLRHAMGAAADDLARMRCDDPAAANAMSTIRHARVLLTDGWLPFLAQLETCGVMDGYIPARLDGSDLREATLLAAQADGWLVLTDPLSLLSAVQPMAESDAIALAELLLDGDERELFDTPAELTWLATRFDEISSDAALLAAFESVFPPTSVRWAALCDWLSVVRIERHDDDDGPVDAVFAAVAAMHPSWPDTEPLLDAMEPYSAALLITNLELDRDTLASAAYDVMVRWWSGPEDGGRQWFDDGPWGDHTADILFEHLANRPDAATHFLTLATEHPGVVFSTADDQRNVVALLTAGTAPGRVDSLTAGVIIVPMIRYVTFLGPNAGSVGTYGPSMLEIGATLSMPWLLHFSTRAPEWGWTAEEAAEALATVIEDGDALMVVADMLDSVMNEIQATPLVADGALNIPAVLAASTAYWEILAALETQEIAFGDDLRFFFDFFIEVGTMALDLVPMSSSRKLLADEGIPVVVDLLERLEVIPPDTDEVRDAAYKTMEQRAVECAVSVVAIVVHQLIEQGMLPADSLDDLTFADLGGGCMPSLAYERLSAYVLDLPLDPHTTTAVWGALNTFFNTSTGRLLCRGE